MEYWAKCLERWKPEKAGDLYPIKKEAEEIKALCMASIQTMEKKTLQLSHSLGLQGFLYNYYA
ncbi:MAG: hypothetical protein IPH36_16795 [Saprospiraceae bacterium]|nr:hypothetical protein [Saprospiraceae bacterium]